jgi:hypothetical protein
MEMAAIFYFAESDRKKGEGRVLKKPQEKIVFIAENCYPLWLIPWNGRTLIFDGLEFTNPSISFDVLPDIKAFENDIQTSSKSLEAYVVALSQNSSYFQIFSGKEEKNIEGLITNPYFAQDLVNYLQEAEEIRKEETTKAILSPLLDESEVLFSIDKITELEKKVKEDIKTLSSSMKLLSKQTKKQMDDLQSEIKKTIKEFDKKIKKTKPKVMKRIKKIQEIRDKDVTRISRKYDRKLRNLHQKRIRIEKTIERLTTDIEHCEAKIRSCREHKDEAGEFQLSKKRAEVKKKLTALNKAMKEIDREIENVEDEKKIAVARARTKQDEYIDEAMKCLHDIEATKEARIRLEQKELADLEEKTSSIIKQIDAMTKAKEVALNEIDSIGSIEKIDEWTLLYVPVYLVCYKTEAKRRHVIYPPSWICNMGIKTKLKSVFGAGKMKSFLQCRSNIIATLLDRLVDLTQENPVFEKEIMEAGMKANILRTTELKLGIKKGLSELKDEGWISNNEIQMLQDQI